MYVIGLHPRKRGWCLCYRPSIFPRSTKDQNSSPKMSEGGREEKEGKREQRTEEGKEGEGKKGRGGGKEEQMDRQAEASWH